MLQRLVYIWIVLLGISFYPLDVAACQEAAHEASMACCAEQHTAADSEKDCCAKTKKNSHPDDCEQDASCHCPVMKMPMHIVAFSVRDLDVEVPSLHHDASRPVHIPQSGFTHIWLPPKIA